MTRILVSAAEPSADRYVARLIPALRTVMPGCAIDAIGGPATAAAGASILHDFHDLQAFGLIEAAGTLRTHLRLYRDLKGALGRRAWDLVILCDYPGWHLQVGHACKAAGVPVLYYIAPQLWAWGAWRSGRLRRAADQVAVVLPFEESFFASRDVPARFVGHPLLDEPRPARADARRALNLPMDAEVLAVLPGARPDDLRRHWPQFAEAAALLRRRRGVHVVVGGVPGRQYGHHEGFTIAAGGAGALAAADVALLKSGTATLEAALANVPAVVSYRLHAASWFVARRAVRVRWVSLASLVADERVHPEILQRAATPVALADALERLLDDPERRERQGAQYATVRSRLGRPGTAHRVATLGAALAA